MTTLTRTKTDGAWSTTEDVGGGGGGDLPDWWSVDSTPGAESVTFNGVVAIKDPNNDYYLISGYDPDGTTLRIEIGSDGTIYSHGGSLGVTDADDATVFEVTSDGRIRSNDSGQTVFEVADTGAVTISPSDETNASLVIHHPAIADGQWDILELRNSDTGVVWVVDSGGGGIHKVLGTGATFAFKAADNGVMLGFADDRKIRFFDGVAGAYAPQQTGVPVTAAGIHAALVAYGLITA